MKTSGFMLQVYGCISTGKEACVFYSYSKKHGHCALKVHKTAKMEFKKRADYLAGDMR